MAFTVLGLTGSRLADPAAALYLDGRLAAAVEEERFVRERHAPGSMPREAARFCLESAGIALDAADVVAVALPPGGESADDRARVGAFLEELGFDPAKTRITTVDYLDAHAASAYLGSGFAERTAILCLAESGSFFGYGEAGRIHRLHESAWPHSLWALYGAMTEYLGFEMGDGEYKLMGMAPYGDARRYDLSRLARFEDGELVVDTSYVNVADHERYEADGRRYAFSQRLVDWLGRPRRGDAADEPYVHYAAATQALFENLVGRMIDHHLGDVLRDTGRIAFAGAGALNVKLNQRIVARADVRELFVQPAAGDAGTALGAAAAVSAKHGVVVERMEHVYLGARYTNEDVVAACRAHSVPPRWQVIDDVPRRVARLLADGHPVAWFQGRMEFGPRALGARSILGCPSVPGVADRINEQIKFRERWRPFGPAMLDRVAPRMLAGEHPAPFMTLTFDVVEDWKSRVPEVVHEDGTARAQVVRRELHPRYYALIEELEKLTGNGVVLNTSLNRRGEPIVCSPQDALDMFFGCDLRYLVMEDVLAEKG
ncbi:MAG TPA: carbamoyltransferase C-terminal domain-containing protein [Aromatoleum sp.]|uniref:carbamoyltransferase family protein n=1 Tax=Aromatoleum sp. TaxID=2307007 RepID=UPI002B48C343|nr:carbamoyltransferase C-terminal domain-containing protein [Aromatoleum sp.]HJV28421.1 carbamoyltransferase C-terminal domain-containing protein [Aromatoleum sp.]